MILVTVGVGGAVGVGGVVVWAVVRGRRRRRAVRRRRRRRDGEEGNILVGWFGGGLHCWHDALWVEFHGQSYKIMA